MRSLIFTTAFTILVTTAFAQKETDSDKRFRLATSATCTVPLGSFSYAQKENSILGQAKNNFGGELLVSKPIYHDWILGFYINYNRFVMDEGAVRQYMQSRYASNDFYVSYTGNEFGYDLWQVGLEFSHNFRFRHIELEPYVRLLALGIHGGYESVGVRRKMKNDSYEENINLTYSGSDHNFIYPSVGVHINAPLTKYVYLVGGAQLMAGKMNVVNRIETTDIFGGGKTEEHILSQSVNAFQAMLGIQVRMGRR